MTDLPTEPLDARTIFQRVGGIDAFTELAAQFYEGVSQDELLRPMYVEEDLVGSRRRLALFLAQYFGGPTTYSEERGHPRLRMRHLPFPIDEEARDRWMIHMHRALDNADFESEVKDAMREYFERAATFLINR